MSIKTYLFVFLFILAFHVSAYSADLVYDDGGEHTISTDTVVSGDIWIEKGSTLKIENATVTLELEYDEQYHIDISGDSKLIVNNGIIKSTGGQYWLEARKDGGASPSIQISGDSTWFTNHSGIRCYDSTTVTVTGGDVEELQANDNVNITLTNSAAYPVLFFKGKTATLSNLNVSPDYGIYDITTSVSAQNGWSFTATNANIEGWQIDLEFDDAGQPADVSLSNGDGIVLSVKTDGNLGDGIVIVENITSATPTTGSLNNLGHQFNWTDSNIALLNLYTFGGDKVLLRGLHVNEVNAEENSHIIVGDGGYVTPNNCNLCQTYGNAAMTIRHSNIDSTNNTPSVTSNGAGVFYIHDSDLSGLYVTAREASAIYMWDNTNVDNSLHKALDADAQIIYDINPLARFRGN